MRQTAAQRRNINPHAEAIVAMYLWGDEYAHRFRGGSMEFWDNLGPARQKICRDLVDKILGANERAKPV